MNRQWVRLNQVSPHVINALIATEDHRFYRHHGVDFLRLATGSLRIFIGDPEGGSTLTQQLARNLYPEEIGRQRTLTRKIKETITAFKIEYAYTKREILETYLNSMPFLYNAFGIEMAARTYFDKPAQKLTILESATLIAMLKGTSYYNPVLNPERAFSRRNVVLAQMVKHGFLTQADFDRLKSRPIRLNFEPQQEALGPAPHLAAYIRKWLIDWADHHDLNIYYDGLIVHTTIDSRLQAIANQAVNREMESLQAVADVEWGMSSGRLLSSSTAPYVDAPARATVCPFLENQPGIDRHVHPRIRCLSPGNRSRDNSRDRPGAAQEQQRIHGQAARRQNAFAGGFCGDRSGHRTHQSVGRQPRLQDRSVRSRGAGAPSAWLDVQAVCLRRGARAGDAAGQILHRSPGRNPHAGRHRMAPLRRVAAHRPAHDGA
jgi:hypothetical protein